MCEELEPFKKLELYIGKKVRIEKEKELSFTFNNLQLDLQTYENVAILYDGDDEDSKVYIPTFDLDGVIATGNGIHGSMIEIDSTHYNYFITCEVGDYNV